MNAVQSVNTPRLVVGAYVPTGYHWNKVEVGGNFSGPLHENASDLSALALDRAEGDHMANSIAVGIAFFGPGSSSGKHFTGCNVNTLTITATAGDVINFTIDFVGMYPPTDFSSSYEGIACAKLLTWDRLAIGHDGGDPAQSFTMTINNNLERQYNLDGGGDGYELYPIDITAGMREITGTIVMYAMSGMPDFGPGLTNVSVNVDGVMSFDIPALMHRPEGSAAPSSAATYALNFTSVCKV